MASKQPGRVRLVKSTGRWLYMSISADRQLDLAWVNDKKIIGARTFVNGASTERLLVSINTFIKRRQLKIDGLVFAIDKNVGFSQSRILLAVINGLALVWAVPVKKLTV